MSFRARHGKNTLVEITIHKNRAFKQKNKHSENCQIGAECVHISPSSTLKKKEASNVEQPKEETTIKGLLKELEEIVKVSGYENIQDFVDELGSNNVNVNKETSVVKLSSSLYPTHLEKIEALERKCLNLKNEVVKCKSENEELSKLLKVDKEAANGLELEIFELKKLISRLTRNNAELLRMASQHFKNMDMVAKLDEERIQLSEHLRMEKCHSSDLQQKLQHAESEVAALRNPRLSPIPDILMQSSALLERPVHTHSQTILHKDSVLPLMPMKPSKLSKIEARKQSPNPAYIVHLCTTTLANAPSFQEELSHPVFQPTALELAETFSTSVRISQDQAHAKDGITDATVNIHKPQLKSLSASSDISHIPPSLTPDLSSSPYRDLDMGKDTLTSRCSSLTEGKFLRGLEKSIELTEFSD